MAAAKQFWTAFVSVLFALLASLGLATPATARGEQPAPTGDRAPGTPATASGARSGAAGPAAESPGGSTPGSAPASGSGSVRVPAQRTASTHAYSGAKKALPPTLKQRIRAEAHGSSPSVRHLRADVHAPVSADLAHLTDQTEETSPAPATRNANAAKSATAA
ncbi:DUF6344 domain-containing protein [Streptomyces sp. NPDC046203]|uniref:DUF6344 domain-containing protein n=1 Tax=Streptomyces sp. NPDC046203 TaxID=3154602 RepID=UPI0033D84261